MTSTANACRFPLTVGVSIYKVGGKRNMTIGYGDFYFNQNDSLNSNFWYTITFNATSSASAIRGRSGALICKVPHSASLEHHSRPSR